MPPDKRNGPHCHAEWPGGSELGDLIDVQKFECREPFDGSQI
jgi:hypothetical protein